MEWPGRQERAAVLLPTNRKGFVATQIEFAVENTVLRGRLFAPEGDGPRPGVVMAPGFSATSHFAVFESYARGIADVGIAALLFDVRGFGYSDGEPRHGINPWAQARDYLAAVDFLRSAQGIDPSRVGVWGVSLSAAIASVVAATDPQIAAVVLQVPAFGDVTSPPDPTEERFDAIRDTLLHADFDTMSRATEGPLPVVSATQEDVPALLQTLTAFHWFIDSGARFGTEWVNRATVVRLDTAVPFDSQTCVPHITAPTLMLIAERDEMDGADADVAREVFALAPQPKHLVTVQGGHFGVLYDGSPEFGISLAAQQRFLTEHLLH